LLVLLLEVRAGVQYIRINSRSPSGAGAAAGRSPLRRVSPGVECGKGKPRLKVFISYSNHDRTLAERLFEDVYSAGAEVFQYSKTAKAGKSSWTQVLTWISDSDVFIVLVSQSALISQPVAEEIDHAHHSYINEGKPNLIIPAIIENGAKPPTIIARFARIDLMPYEGGVKELFGQLGLTRKAAGASSAKLAPLPDLSALFLDYQKTHPEPSPIRRWSLDAAKIVANYNAVAPKEIGNDVRAHHIDAILADYSGKKDNPKPLLESNKYDSLFYGSQPAQTEIAKPASGKLPKLSQSLLSYDPANWYKPLKTPTLSVSLGGIQWDAIADAAAYVVEESLTADFQNAKEAYRGPDTKYTTLHRPYYRVKAVGGVFRQDSQWSNAVGRWAALPAGGKISRALDRPSLSIQGAVLSWTEVQGALGYVLESKSILALVEFAVIYEGAERRYFDLSAVAGVYHYRVKAKGVLGLLDSLWSNVVTSQPIDWSKISDPNAR
jgi:hypothetical protein